MHSLLITFLPLILFSYSSSSPLFFTPLHFFYFYFLIIIIIFIITFVLLLFILLLFLSSITQSSVTICTVGFGDLSPKTDGGRIFTMFFALIGCTLSVKGFSEIIRFPSVLKLKQNEIHVRLCYNYLFLLFFFNFLNFWNCYLVCHYYYCLLLYVIIIIIIFRCAYLILNWFFSSLFFLIMILSPPTLTLLPPSLFFFLPPFFPSFHSFCLPHFLPSGSNPILKRIIRKDFKEHYWQWFISQNSSLKIHWKWNQKE